MSHPCTSCGHIFSSKDSLKKHMNRKVPCVVKESDNKSPFKCKDCNRGFKSNQGLKKHILDRCPILKNKKTEGQILATMQQQIDLLTQTVNELKNNKTDKSAKTINNNTNSHNTTNIQNIENQHININITPFKESKLLEKYIVDTFLDESSAASAYTRLEYMEKANSKDEYVKNLIVSLFLETLENSFEDNIENINVYLDETEIKKNEDAIKFAKVYQGDQKWLSKSVMSVLRKEYNLFIEKCRQIKGKINYPEGTPVGYKNSIDASVGMLSLMTDNKIIANAEPNFSVILDANRDRLKNENII